MMQTPFAVVLSLLRRNAAASNVPIPEWRTQGDDAEARIYVGAKMRRSMERAPVYTVDNLDEIQKRYAKEYVETFETPPFTV